MSASSTDRIIVTIEDGVADVRLNRADKMNALDPAMFDALIATGEQLRQTPDLRAVVLSGEGRAFCAGLDMESMAGMLGNGAGGDPGIRPGRLAARAHGISNRPQYACMVWRELPVPVFAAVHGVAFGGGLQVALGADVRFVTADTKLSIMEIKWGLVPDMAGMVLTRGLVRPDLLRELIYTGRVVTGTEACELGLATRVVGDPRAPHSKPRAGRAEEPGCRPRCQAADESGGGQRRCCHPDGGIGRAGQASGIAESARGGAREPGKARAEV